MRLARQIGVVSGDDIRVFELGDRLDLAFKSLENPTSIERRRGNDLERDDAFHAAMLGLQDDSHAPFAKLVRESPS